MNFLRMVFLNMKRMFKNKTALVLSLFLPIVVILILTAFTKGSSLELRSFYIVNSDSGIYSNELIEELSKSYKISIYTKDEALENLRNKRIKEFYEIDEGFSKALENGQMPDLKAYRREPLNSFNDFEIKVKSIVNKLTTIAQIEKSSGVNTPLSSLNSKEVKVKVNTLNNTNVNNQILINLLISFNFFCAIGMCYELFALRDEKTLTRSLYSSNKLSTIIASILGGQFLLTFLEYVFVYFLSVIVYDKALIINAPITILNLLMTTLTALSLAVFISRILKNEKLISVVLQMIICCTCYIGGAFTPVEFLPKSISFFSKFTPQYWAIESIKTGRYEYSLIVLLFAVLLFTAGTQKWQPYDV